MDRESNERPSRLANILLISGQVVQYGRLKHHAMKDDPHSIPPETAFRTRTLWNCAKITAACLLITLFSALVGAQSGRRLAKAPGSTPEATPEPKPDPKSASVEKPKVSITLGINGHEMFANVPIYFYDSVLASCGDRLRAAPSVTLDVSGRDMNRADAIRLAKAQKEGFVAFLELRTDGTAAAVQNNNYDELYLEYFVFAPETAKTVTSGRAYQQVYKNRGVIMNPKTSGRNSTVYTEQLLKQAARDAADRILSALRLVLPNSTLPGF